MYWTRKISSPVGLLTLVTDGKNLCGVFFEQPRFPTAALLQGQPEERPLAVLDAAAAWLRAYFAGERPSLDALPMRAEGTGFQQQVWRELAEIPYGSVTTYGALARELARKRGGTRVSAQAVGGAVGRNPLSIILPCHRVVGAGGALVGYGGGLERKRWLLRHEGVVLPD